MHEKLLLGNAARIGILREVKGRKKASLPSSNIEEDI